MGADISEQNKKQNVIMTRTVVKPHTTYSTVDATTDADRTNNWQNYLNQYSQGAQQGRTLASAMSGTASGGYSNQYAGNAATGAMQNYLSGAGTNYSTIWGTTGWTKGSGKAGSVDSATLWNMYADQAQRGGQQAMRDTIGQYEANTGGYANSLATGAAAKAYYDYLGDLNDQWADTHNEAHTKRVAHTTPGYDVLDVPDAAEDAQNTQNGVYTWVTNTKTGRMQRVKNGDTYYSDGVKKTAQADFSGGR